MVAALVEDVRLPSVLNTKATLQIRNILQNLYFHDVASNFVVFKNSDWKCQCHHSTARLCTTKNSLKWEILAHGTSIGRCQSLAQLSPTYRLLRGGGVTAQALSLPRLPRKPPTKPWIQGHFETQVNLNPAPPSWLCNWNMQVGRTGFIIRNGQKGDMTFNKWLVVFTNVVVCWVFFKFSFNQSDPNSSTLTL